MQYLGIDWGTRRTAWCASTTAELCGRGSVPAERDGLSRLALTLGTGEVLGCIEMMSGAVLVRDQLAPRVDARVLADLVRRDLVPEVWVPSLEDRPSGANRWSRCSA